MNLTRIPARRLLLAILFFAFLILPAEPGLAVDRTEPAIRYAATIQPLAAILEEVVGERGQVTRLLQPGSSPHTFEPKPSDVAMLSQARALFYAGPGLDKEWVGGMPVRDRIEMLGLVPPGFRLPMAGHDHGHASEEKGQGSIDPHFWTDPLTVKAMLPALAQKLTTLDPAGSGLYRQNAQAFAVELEQLHRETAEILRPVLGRPVLLFHLSFQYLLHRYNLELAGLVEPFPGREPSPKFIHSLIRTVQRSGTKALFTEPQLPERPARVIAEATGLKVYELDPNGGQEGRRSYREILLHNARILETALQ